MSEVDDSGNCSVCGSPDMGATDNGTVFCVACTDRKERTMTSYYGHTGYTTPNGEALCIECAQARYTDDQLAGSTPVNEAGETLGVIFISSEWDYAPSCDDCNEVIDCTVICSERASEHPTLTLNDDGEYVEPSSPDAAWTEVDMRGYLDQTDCDCCGLMTSHYYMCLDGGDTYCPNCVTIV